MIDQNGNKNRGWKVKRLQSKEETRLDKDGKLQDRCPFCFKFVPYGSSFHYEECGGKS